MKTVKTRGKEIQIPDNVSELTPEQYEQFCYLGFALNSGIITPDYFCVRWLSYLVGLKKMDFVMLKPEFSSELERQLPAVESFLVRKRDVTTGQETTEADFNSVVNLLPEYRGYRGPEDLMMGVTFGDFVRCYSIIEGLGGSDEETTAAGYSEIARILYHIPEEEKVPELLIFHAPRFFLNVWETILATPIEINGKKIDFRIIFKSSSSERDDDKTGWTGITFEVAGAGIFGDIERVRNADLWEVMIYLYKCKFEYLREQSRNKHN